MKKNILLLLVLAVSVLNIGATDPFYIIDEELSAYVDKRLDEQKFHPVDIAVVAESGETWSLGQDVDEAFREKINVSIPFDRITSDYPYPAIVPSYKNDEMTIGVYGDITYMELHSDSVQTKNGFKVGDTKERVVEFFGQPDTEYSNETIYSYRNDVFNVFGIEFYFENDIVHKIVVFMYYNSGDL